MDRRPQRRCCVREKARAGCCSWACQDQLVAGHSLDLVIARLRRGGTLRACLQSAFGADPWAADDSDWRHSYRVPNAFVRNRPGRGEGAVTVARASQAANGAVAHARRPQCHLCRLELAAHGRLRRRAAVQDIRFPSRVVADAMVVLHGPLAPAVRRGRRRRGAVGIPCPPPAEIPRGPPCGVARSNHPRCRGGLGPPRLQLLHNLVVR
mmetsp:Transcript_45380/g.125941  ORF Transcript_45380/g.125941 Transcript_45380/m.125941 type:complete len:209 (-) Transcript_45380:289-915(-)